MPRANPFSTDSSGAVQDSTELQRILDVPRRVWEPDQAATLASQLTAALRTTAGTWNLRPVQAIALFEASRMRGLFAPIRVGGGKTLLSGLLPTVLGARRPMLLLPAHLREKTLAEFEELRIHWRIPPHVWITSYQELGRAAAAERLEEILPDAILADECHYLKNRQAAVTKRVARYMKAHPSTAFCGMSGTVTKRSISDFAHLTWWALKSTNPVPEDFPTLQEWMRALDVNVAPHRRLAPGALTALGSGPIREEFRDRLTQSPGVVATQEPPLPIQLTVRSTVLTAPAEVDTAFHRLRTRWVTPDGWEIADGIAVWRHAREFSSGFFYKWDPRPPRDWQDARRGWMSAAREILGNNRRNLDSELQAREAVRAGLYPWATPFLEEWERIKDTFEPNTVPVWVSDHAVQYALQWARQNPQGIVWVEHRATGERLADLGLPYYGRQGIDHRTGQRIENHRGGACVASVVACGTGRNLQHFRQNLIMSAPPNGAQWEQLLGRTHRDGQEAEEVTVEVLMGSREDVAGFWRAVDDSAYMESMTGQAHKLVHADTESMVTMADVDTWPGWAWQRNIT